MDLQSFSQTFSLALLTLSFSLLLPHWRSNEQVRVFTLMVACTICYLFAQLVPLDNSLPHQLLAVLLFIGYNSLTGSFWLMSLSLFSDQHKISKGHIFIGLSPLTFATLAVTFNSLGVESWGLFWKHATATTDILLVVHAAAVAISYWRDDLVEERRTTRANVIIFSALFIATDIVLGQVLKVQANWLDAIQALLLTGIVFALHRQLLSLKLSPLFELPEGNLTTKDKSEEDEAVTDHNVKLLLNSMEQDSVYRQEGITIGGLATQLGMHEYKLRRLINNQLNYRNFNDFLNYYRIKDASEMLAKAELQSTPILTIALDVGFRSLSSFNKAFKETHNMTPTQFRKQG